MPKAQSGFSEGQRVTMTCYYHGCEQVSIPVTLGKKSYIRPDFTREEHVGRLHWRPGTKIVSFEIAGEDGKPIDIPCPNCPNHGHHTHFAYVLIVSLGRGKKSLIFGYESGGE